MDMIRRLVTPVTDYCRRIVPSAAAAPPLPDFEYEALEPDHIRVLTLLPGREEDPISCEFHTVSRAAAGAFDFSALSYCWGPEPRVLEAVTVVAGSNAVAAGPRRLSVRPNLYQALVALRHGSPGPMTFWIDAVCINQADTAEKAEQIRHMDQIYARAKSIVIWLGPAGDDSDYVWEVISEKRSGEYATRRFIAGTLAIMGRPWFSRLWVVQEFVLNRASPLMACGYKRMVIWDEFCAAYSVANPPAMVPDCDLQLMSPEHKATLVSLLPGSFDQQRLFTLLRGFRIGVQSTSPILGDFYLRHALWSTRSFQATDLRDKIYGVLALTTKETRDKLEIDYKKSIADVFCDAAIYILQVERSAALYVLVPLGRETRPSLPSWVPDFGSEHGLRDTTGGQFINESRIPLHNAEDVKVSVCGKRLLVKALFLDTVVSTFTASPVPSTVPFWAYPQVVITILLALRDSIISLGGVGWLSLQECLAYCSTHAGLIGKSRSIAEIERLAGARVLRTGYSGPADPLWKTLLFSGALDDEFQNERECQAKFDRLMVGIRSIAANERPYGSWLPSLRTRYLVQDIKAAEPLSSRIFAAFDLQRTFFSGLSMWYGFAEGDVTAGDKLALLFPGANVPFVLRKKNDGYEMVGLARIPAGLHNAAIEAGIGKFQDVTIY